ncbi:hypothetical protein BH23CHL5_BH23CHL5_00850 [soil metagenome]
MLAGTTYRFQRGIILAILGALCVTSLIPTVTSADTNLVIGGPAVIAYANGDQVRLRQDFGYESPVLAMYDEGIWVSVQDGPFVDTEGKYWYQVAVGDLSAGGLSGFIVADYLALDSGTSLETVAAAEEGTSVEASTPAVGAVIGVAYVAGTNGDGVRCRNGASSSSLVVTVIPEGSPIELTGAPVDSWQPINCGGTSGYVSLDFVSWNAPGAVAAPVAAVEEQIADTTVEEPLEEAVVEEVAKVVTEEPISDEGTPAPAVGATGTAFVSGTNGDGVRCRVKASYDGNVVTVLTEGTPVELAGAAQGEWQPVFCGGTNGFVHGSFLSSDALTPVADEDQLVSVADVGVGGPSGAGTISGTNGDGVRCRSGASYTASIINVISEGSLVTLRGAVQGEWQPVQCANQNGFVHASFVKAESASMGTQAVSTASSAGTAKVISAGGLNCRSNGSMMAPVITVLANGTSVSLRSGSITGWQAVVCAGQNGFVSNTYIEMASGSSSGSTSGSTASSGSYAAGASAQVTGTGGGGLRLRSTAGYSGTVMAVIPEGTNIAVRSGSTGEWVAVTFNGSMGFVHKDFVGSSTGTPVSSESGNTSGNPSSTGSTSTSLASGDRAKVTTDLRLRYQASYSAGIAAIAPAGTVVGITGAASNGFYPVNWDGLSGFMHGDYLTKTTEALSKRGGSASAPTAPPSGTQSGTAVGNAIVSYAMQYVGYPYVWATAGPSSFDCSGFTYWVVKNVVGKDIGRGLFTQVGAGRAVGRSELIPGDFLYFQNTYTAGLSHSGIYIGNNQFVHAENPTTGVRVSDLNSTYYSTRWYGAVRMG